MISEMKSVPLVDDIESVSSSSDEKHTRVSRRAIISALVIVMVVGVSIGAFAAVAQSQSYSANQDRIATRRLEGSEKAVAPSPLPPSHAMFGGTFKPFSARSRHDPAEVVLGDKELGSGDADAIEVDRRLQAKSLTCPPERCAFGSFPNPNCDGGCDQRNANSPTCDGGGCDQRGAMSPQCKGGRCNQADAKNPTCNGGRCSTTGDCRGGGCCDPKGDTKMCDPIYFKLLEWSIFPGEPIESMVEIDRANRRLEGADRLMFGSTFRPFSARSRHDPDPAEVVLGDKELGSGDADAIEINRRLRVAGLAQ